MSTCRDRTTQFSCKMLEIKSTPEFLNICVCATLATWRICCFHMWLHKCNSGSSSETVTKLYIKYIHSVGLMSVYMNCPQRSETYLFSSKVRFSFSVSSFTISTLAYPFILSAPAGGCCVSSGCEARLNTCVFSPIMHLVLTTLFLPSPIQEWQLSSHSPHSGTLPVFLSPPPSLLPLHTFSFRPLLCAPHRSSAGSGSVLLHLDGIWFAFLG